MKHSLSTRLLAVGGAGVLAFGLAACGGAGDAQSGSDSDSVALSLAITQGADSAVRQQFSDLIDDFEAANPGITVEMLPATNQYESDMKVKMAANDLPDLFATHGWSVKRYSPFLEPLTDEPWAQDMSPLLDGSMRDENGDLFAFPTEIDVFGLSYNAEVLESVGVDPASISSWDDFDSACEKVVAAGNACIFAWGKDVYYPGNIANTIAPGIFTEDEERQLSEGTFVDSAWEKVATQVDEWVKAGYFNKDYVSATSDDAAKALAQDKAAFVFNSTSLLMDALSYNPEAKLGYMPIPAASGGTYVVGGEGLTALGVAKNGNVDAAKKFLAFLAQPENAARLVAGSGNPSGLTNVTADLGPLQDSYTRVAETGESLVPYFDRTWLPNGMWATVCTSVDSLITGQGTVESTTQQMHTEFDSLYAQNQ